MEEGREEPPADEAPADPSGDQPLEEFYGRDDLFGFAPTTPRPAPPPRKKPRTATGALMAGVALGLQQVFDPEKKKDPVAIEQEAPGEPVGPQRYEVKLNGSPRDSQAVYRPWVDDDED